jgi:hypothetical protein
MGINSSTTNAVQRAIPSIREATPSSNEGRIEQLIGYIPTETIGLYGLVAPLIPLAGLPLIALTLSRENFYWFVAILTPVIYLGTFYTKAKTKVEADPSQKMPSLNQYPLWETVTACIAFLLWALTLQDNPYNFEADTVTIWIVLFTVSVGLLNSAVRTPLTDIFSKIWHAFRGIGRGNQDRENIPAQPDQPHNP